MRVLISGGGIAGLTLAYWLRQYNILPVVIEQANSIRRGGYAIDFYGTGYDVAECMGILNQLRQQQIHIDSISYVGKSGKPIATLDISLMQKVMHDRYMALMHWTLEEALYEAIGDDIEVQYGRSLTAVEAGPDEVVVTFNDETTETFDILIGADGVHSNTRRLVFGSEEQYHRYLGYRYASYALPDLYGIGRAWKNYTEPGRLASAYRSNDDDEIITFFMYKTADEEYMPREQRLPHLRQAFANMGWITSNLLDNAPDPNAIFMDSVTQIQMPAWHRGRVVLVGDACGCPTLLSGQGVSMAMGGAYLLAQAIHEMRNYEKAFLHYEQHVRPHVEQRQKNARDFARLFVPGSTFEVLVQHMVLKLFLRDSFTGLLRKQFGADSFLETQLPHHHS